MTAEIVAPDTQTIRAGLEIACRAPSVHNTQPWRWSVSEHEVHLFADRARRLPVIDPDGREMLISCGAALHHARIAFRALGWSPVVQRMPSPGNPDHLATIELHRLTRVDPRLATLVEAARRRHTDRRPYLPVPVPPQLLDRLAYTANAEQVRVTLLTEQSRRREMIDALMHADAVQRQDPMYQAEVAEWVRHRPDATQGIPVSTVPQARNGGFDMAGRRFSPGTLEMPASASDGATLYVLSTGVDNRLSWLRTGEALSALLLAAAKAKLASCTLSQVSEVPAVRDLARRVALGGTGEPHLVVRVGWPVTVEFPGPPVARRPVDEVINTG